MPTLLTFGDSNTHGSLPIEFEGQRRRLGAEARWPGVALAELGADWQLIEEGLPGRTTCHSDPDMGAHMDGGAGLNIALESHGPIDFMTMMLGTNDLKSFFDRSARQITDDLAALLDVAQSEEMQERHGGFAILLICPPAILEQGVIADKFGGGRAKSLEMPALYGEAAAARGLGFLDAGTVIQSSSIDGIHFGAEMHRALGQAVAGALVGMAAAG